MLLFHILIAFLSLIAASLTAHAPTKQKLIFTYISTAGTLISGVLMIIIEPVSVARVCISGSIYLVALATLVIIARRKIWMIFDMY